MANQADGRIGGTAPDSALCFGDLTVERSRRVVYFQGKPQKLSEAYFNVLLLLIDRGSTTVTKSELAGLLGISESSLPKVMEAIRDAIGDTDMTRRYIRTERGAGYRFIGVATEPPTTSVATSPRVSSRAPRLGIAAAAGFVLIIIAIFFRPTAPDPRLVRGTEITKSQEAKLSPLLTDGRRLYFGEYDNGRYTVLSSSAASGETIKIPIGIHNPELCDIAPQGEQLLIRDLVHSRDEPEPLFLVSPTDGAAEPLRTILAYDAAWHPDGNHIVYTLDGQFYITDLLGKHIRKLLRVSGNAFWIRWSPDHTRMRFTVIDQKSEATSIWEATGDGRDAHQVALGLSQTSHPCCGSWTPNGKYFVFQVRANNVYQIWARREMHSPFFRSTATSIAVTSGPLNYRGPLPSRDGKRIFVRTENPKGEIVRLEKKSGPYASILPSISPRTAAFSQDGGWIVYGSLTDNNLWRCRANGNDCLQLTSGFQQCAMPRWSPDGQHIAFMGRRFGNNWRLFIVSANGERLEQLPTRGESDGDPDWSPDGNELVFGNVLDPPEKMEIYHYDFRTHSVAVVPNSQGMFSPRWSPDGRILAAVRREDHQLAVLRFPSREWKTIAQLSAAYPNWSHDGKFLFFYSENDGRRSVYRTQVSTGQTIEVANLDSVRQGPWIFGTWVGLATDDCPLAIRNQTTETIYAWDLDDK